MLGLVLACRETPSAPPAPLGGNVLLVVVDDVGIDQVAAYGVGADPPATPTLDALSAEGVTFRHAWSYPTCSPSRAAMLTGRHARHTGIGEWIDPYYTEWSLAQEELTLPEVLGPEWETALVGKWHLVAFDGRPEVPFDPLDQGFGAFDGTLANLGNAVIEWGPPRDYYRWERDVDGTLTLSTSYATTATTDEAIARAHELEPPWFLVVSYNAAHYPVQAPPPALLDGPAPVETRDVYRAMVTALDREIGRLMDGIPPDVLAGTTTIVVSDNGTPDHGIAPPLDPTHGKDTVWELGVHVPLVVTGPLVEAPGTTSDALVHATDVFATVADIAGADASGIAHDGRSLVPWLRDPAGPSAREVLFTEWFRPNGPGPYTEGEAAARDRSYKLVRDVVGQERLYAIDDRGLETGPDLLGGSPGPDALDALARLRVEIDSRTAARVR